jgi:OOP family OmpA-OmpF porin
MKTIRSGFYPIIILFALVAIQACKAKKAVQASTPVKSAAAPANTAELANSGATDPSKTQNAGENTSGGASATTTGTDKPDYNNLNNIQFEFDSSILQTDSYAFLDKAAAAIKMSPSTKFAINGYASAEGTDEHNMRLSVERANAVKVYLVNSGVSASNLIALGYGEANPVADNTTEAGKILNRRVEIKTK